MTKRFQPGMQAVIMVSEHPANINRIVWLEEDFEARKGPGWVVSDGRMFDGYDRDKMPEKVVIRAEFLAIEQWKLRLLEDDDKVEIRNGIKYAEQLA